MDQKTAPKKKIKKVKWLIPILTFLVLLVLSGISFIFKSKPSTSVVDNGSPAPVQIANLITLPTPQPKSNTSIEAALKNRRTIRTFADEPITLKSASQMLWAGQGITAEWGGRTTPSAKSTYPLNIYLIANKIEGLNPGQYIYIPGERSPIHGLKPIKEGEFGKAIYTSLNQNSFKNNPAMFVITGNMGKMAQAYGGISHDKEVYLEAGHAAQNLYLQAESINLGLVANSSFDDSIIRNIISIPEEETIIYLLPFGTPKD